MGTSMTYSTSIADCFSVASWQASTIISSVIREPTIGTRIWS